jgi:hypothetical protein
MIRATDLEIRRSARLPNFLVIGAMKAGTTSLYHYLRRHPQVFMSKIKELDFFAQEGNWHRGFDWYGRQFAAAGEDAVAVGEASTVYAKYPWYRGIPERIGEHLPGARIIYLVRHPVERMRSHYEHRVAVGAERDPIERALVRNPIYLDYSRYALQIERYVSCFPREQILILTSEDLRHDRRRTIRRVFEFLRVDPDHVPPEIHREYYASEGRPVFSPAMWGLRRSLRTRFPGAKRAKELVDSMSRAIPRSGVGRSGQEGSRDRARIPDHVRRHLEDQLRPDIERLRAYLPEHFDGWEVG